MRLRAIAWLLALLSCCNAVASAQSRIVFVPLDDRPVTDQLPVMLGRIAGVRIAAPPQSLLGRYLRAGEPDAIAHWLNGDRSAVDDFVLSSDMLAYGGLVTSRIPGTAYADAYFRLRVLEQLHRRYPRAGMNVFGTVMRLAPTGVPDIGAGATFFAPYPQWTYLQQYANLHDPPLPSEEADAQRLTAQIGAPLLDAYLGARARNYGVDRLLIAQTQAGVIDRLVLGQDDAKAYGLHIPELEALENAAAGNARISIQPGADELGMALVARALVQAAAIRPRVGVVYSTPEGASYQDPLEFEPIDSTIDRLIDLCGGVRNDAAPNIVLAVRLPNTSEALSSAFERDLISTQHVALADLSFEESYPAQDAFVSGMLDDGLAARLDAYAGWNTAANTVGTALAEAFAVAAGRARHTYDARAHRTFTFMRFVDDYAYHDRVRPAINDWLTDQGVTDHTLLLPDVARAASDRTRALLWPHAVRILAQLDPSMHIAAMNIDLPWDRTFEIALDVGIAPNL